nr:retrovirus-related Pol polyprotein from transposon TNT 1-94 [Tanacetum cinerariifolium]
MEGKKLTDLKNKSFDSIQKMYDRAFKRVNTFVDFKTELVEESSRKAEAEVIEGSFKRAGTELEKESLGYNAVPPPYTRNFLPQKPDFSSLEEFVNEPIVSEPTVKKPIVETSKANGNPPQDLQDKGVIDSGCSRHMTRNMSYLTDYEEIDGGYIAFGASKDETSTILKTFITGIENLVDHKVKVIKCDNGTEIKNRKMNQFCEMKEAVNTACYVQNRVLVVKPHNKTLYELFHGRKPSLSFMRPFGCLVAILTTKDHLNKFDGKADDEFFIGYSLNSKAFRVFNNRTRIIKENLHIRFSENIPNIAGSGPIRLFDFDALIKSMNYKPVVTRKQSDGNAGTKACDDAGKAKLEIVPSKDYILLPLWTADLFIS